MLMKFEKAIELQWARLLLTSWLMLCHWKRGLGICNGGQITRVREIGKWLLSKRPSWIWKLVLVRRSDMQRGQWWRVQQAEDTVGDLLCKVFTVFRSNIRSPKIIMAIEISADKGGALNRRADANQVVGHLAGNRIEIDDVNWSSWKKNTESHYFISMLGSMNIYRKWRNWSMNSNK